MSANLLKAKIVEKGMNIEEVSKEIGCDKGTLYRRMRDLNTFTIGEVLGIKRVLTLTDEDVAAIFF